MRRLGVSFTRCGVKSRLRCSNTKPPQYVLPFPSPPKVPLPIAAGRLQISVKIPPNSIVAGSFPAQPPNSIRSVHYAAPKSLVASQFEPEIHSTLVRRVNTKIFRRPKSLQTSTLQFAPDKHPAIRSRQAPCNSLQTSTLRPSTSCAVFYFSTPNS